ncbi:MAG: ATP-binding protein [Chlorobi bacterium]|nr:ATP-binding protein [Chlorobiota bacterium]MCI0715829.1 ATP-binding protein [Chlorobiota bacterium]
MFDFTSKDVLKFKILSYLSLLLLFTILFTFGVKYYFSKAILSDWESISAEKKKQVQAECLNIFYNYQNQTAQFSYSLIRNKKLITAFGNQNTKKAYESLYEAENIDDYNVEIYNSRLELFLFSGRQINPEVTELKKALEGDRFSVVKEIGLYTYIVVFDPVKSETGNSDGVSVVSRLLDVNNEIQNRFFVNEGITKEIFNKHHIEVRFDFKKNAGSNLIDTASEELSSFNLKDINSNNIGKIFFPNLDQSSYLLSVTKKFDGIIGFMAFVLNLLLLYWAIVVSLRAGFIITKIFIAAAALIFSRYIWLIIDFPAKLTGDSGFDIFSPVHFASGIGFGMAKSIGELVITSLVMMALSLYVIINIIQFYKSEQKQIIPKWLSFVFLLSSAIVAIIAIHFFGVIMQSLVYDSTIKFTDKSGLFSANQPEMVVARLLILFLSISLLLILVSCGLLGAKFINRYKYLNKFIRKNSSLFIFAGFAIINLMASLFPDSLTEISLKLNLRILILALAGFLTLFIQRQLAVLKEYRFINAVNFSLILLACVIFIPAVLLNKITTQENRYLEKAAKEISQQSPDRISFLISATLEDINEDGQLQSDIKDKNKFSKLAFNIWSKSKFYDEDLNSSVFVLDTAKKLISDFNINSNDLNSDSVVVFSLRNLNKKKKSDDMAALSEEEDEGRSSLETVSNINLDFESDDVYQNRELKFYSGIVQIEKSGLKNSLFKNILGYVIVAAGYDSKNFLTQSNLSIFKNFTRDNILNKLTSVPVITEFSNGEFAGSSNKDISKSFVKSLEPFRESVKDKIDKSALRYDEFENEIYKSYYVLVDRKGDASSTAEKIYIVSVKINDFGLSTFFFFSYLLFVVFIYLIILTVYFIYRSIAYLTDSEGVRLIKFGFREKIFISFLLASVIPIIILAFYTREYVKDKNEEFYKNQLISDLKIVEQYVKNKFLIAVPVNPYKTLKQESSEGFSDLFGKGFSGSDKNFNFYAKTKLVSTTNEQLYKSDLLDTRISGTAFYNIVLMKRDYFSENRQIGNFTFIVGYKPIYDSFNNLIGIISSQTVFKQNEINQELTESLVYILGPYFTAVIILIFIVNILSYRISNPILKLQKATEQLSKGNIDVQVQSDSKDEIGELVKSFNRMIKELKRSRVELKKAEREGAWRDIARQVAHEIKNPLTPMKLAMQHLYRVYTRGGRDFKTVIQTTNKLIVDQIETLNKIATEFSNFAKLPSRNYEPLDINEVLKDVVKLMDSEGRIKIKLEGGKSTRLVMGDKDELKRALINIVKNSMQAIEEKDSGEKGLINIESGRSNGYYLVKIIDNGVGMDDETRKQLFEPYFSTKSNGMGLGLVITKKILDDMKARIYIKSEENKGTEVELRFKIVEK